MPENARSAAPLLSRPTAQTKPPYNPRSLLPFKIEESSARRQFQRWIQGLWFSPECRLKKYARSDAKLTGVYLPLLDFRQRYRRLIKWASGAMFIMVEQTGPSDAG